MLLRSVIPTSQRSKKPICVVFIAQRRIIFVRYHPKIGIPHSKANHFVRSRKAWSDRQWLRSIQWTITPTKVAPGPTMAPIAGMEEISISGLVFSIFGSEKGVLIPEERTGLSNDFYEFYPQSFLKGIVGSISWGVEKFLWASNIWQRGVGSWQLFECLKPPKSASSKWSKDLWALSRALGNGGIFQCHGEQLKKVGLSW